MKVMAKLITVVAATNPEIRLVGEMVEAGLLHLWDSPRPIREIEPTPSGWKRFEPAGQPTLTVSFVDD
jgi:hypothetical protein